jgi:hypothetical protein
MKVAYIAHPVGGDVPGNIEKILKIVKQINRDEPDVVPFVPYLADIMALDDSVPEERERGIRNDTHLLEAGFIDEVRLYGPTISTGMHNEIILATLVGIPKIKGYTEETARQLATMDYLKP